MNKALRRTWALFLLDWRTLMAPTGSTWIVPISFLIAVCFRVLVPSPAMFANSCIYLPTMMVGLLFLYGEKSRSKTLYATLAMTRKDVVRGQYLFAFCVQTGILLLSLLLEPPFILAGASMYPAAVFLPGASLLGLVSLSLLCPFGFRWGTWGTLAVGFMLSGPLVGGVFGGTGRTAMRHPVPTLALFALSAAVLFYLSYRLSLRFYRRRDL